MPVIYMEQEDVRSFTEGDIRKLIELSIKVSGAMKIWRTIMLGNIKSWNILKVIQTYRTIS